MCIILSKTGALPHLSEHNYYCSQMYHYYDFSLYWVAILIRSRTKHVKLQLYVKQNNKNLRTAKPPPAVFIRKWMTNVFFMKVSVSDICPICSATSTYSIYLGSKMGVCDFLLWSVSCLPLLLYRRSFVGMLCVCVRVWARGDCIDLPLSLVLCSSSSANSEGTQA